MEVIHFIPVLAAGLYWWFGRGRPVGLLYCFLLAYGAPTAVSVLATLVISTQGAGDLWDHLFPVFAWGGSIGMLYQAWRTPPMKSEGTRTCPFCAEVIKMQAVACRYCGRNLPRIADMVPHGQAVGAGGSSRAGA